MQNQKSGDVNREVQGQRPGFGEMDEIALSLIFVSLDSFVCIVIQIQMDIFRMINSDFAAATILISFGAVLGKVSAVQLLIMAAFEVVIYEVNEYIVLDILKVSSLSE